MASENAYHVKDMDVEFWVDEVDAGNGETVSYWYFESDVFNDSTILSQSVQISNPQIGEVMPSVFTKVVQSPLTNNQPYETSDNLMCEATGVVPQ